MSDCCCCGICDYCLNLRNRKGYEISDGHIELTTQYYGQLIEPLRDVSRNNGYALAVHGSLKRDIDLIAIPWQQIVSQPVVLAEAIQAKALEIIGFCVMTPAEQRMFFWAGMPGAKPHGRLCWSFHLGGGPYIDLSIMPPIQEGDNRVTRIA